MRFFRFGPAQQCRSHTLQLVRVGTVAILAMLTFANSLCAQVGVVVPGKTFAITPMTVIDVEQHIGYFGDPYPVHMAPWLASFEPQYFSGTTPAILSCDRPVHPECFTAAPVSLALSAGLHAAVQAAGNVFGDTINRNIYQMPDGRWQMAVTLYVHPANDTKKRWTVIAHARPTDESSLHPPTSWIADTILIGSLAKFDYANYDGKYFEDEGGLYLIYSKRLNVPGVAHDGVVAQRMKSPTEPTGLNPVLLLGPANGDASLNSEYFHTAPPPGDSFKLIETGNIVRIHSKYVMFYSTGDYQQRDYKTGVAFSDALIPEDGRSYRKVLQNDPEGVWGHPGHREVRYLLQSDKQAWPNYSGSQVLAPGVPSAVEQPDGRFLMFFDGFAPDDAPPAPTTPNNPLNIEADHRRPFYVPLKVDVPAGGSVYAYSDEELASWISAERASQ